MIQVTAQQPAKNLNSQSVFVSRNCEHEFDVVDINGTTCISVTCWNKKGVFLWSGATSIVEKDKVIDVVRDARNDPKETG